jgi:hypothetical protein
MVFHINVGNGGLGGFQDYILNAFGFTHKTHHQSVVVFVCPVVKKTTSFLLSKGFHNSFNNFGISTLAEVGNTFDQLFGHALFSQKAI